MPKATWNGATLAQADTFEEVEGNIYFPPESLNRKYFEPSSTTSHCPWKGDARYYSLNVDGKHLPDAAWYYPAPYEKAAQIKDHVAFWKGVVIER